MKNVMIDLETMSLKPDAAILSIGAVVFDTFTGQIVAEFEQNVQLSSCKELGLRVDESTEAWWAKQERDLRDALTRDAIPINAALARLRYWILDGVIDHNEIIPWSNGAGFDIPILENAFAACGIAAPWMFYNISCYRTLKRLYRSIRIEFEGTKHNALHDARHQARHLMEVLAVMAKVDDR